MRHTGENRSRGGTFAAPRLSCAKRRHQLLRAATRLFADRGFCGTTTKQIALAAEVSEAIVFRHFPTKADLYRGVLDHNSRPACAERRLNELRGRAGTGDDEKFFQSIARAVFELCHGDPDFLRLTLYSALERHELARPLRERRLLPISDLLRDYIARRQREGHFRQSDAGAAARAFVGALMQHAISMTLFDSRPPAARDEEAGANITQLALGGLRRREPVDMNQTKNSTAGNDRSKHSHV